MENLTNDTPPKKGFWTPPLVRYVFHPQVSVLCFSCTKIHDRADQTLVWRGPKIFGRARALARFPSPHTFCTPPPHIPAQVKGTVAITGVHVFLKNLNRVQQTVSGNKPSQYPPDTIHWTLFRWSLGGGKPCPVELCEGVSRVFEPCPETLPCQFSRHHLLDTV